MQEPAKNQEKSESMLRHRHDLLGTQQISATCLMETEQIIDGGNSLFSQCEKSCCVIGTNYIQAKGPRK